MNKNFFEELLNKKKITRYKLCKITGISSGGLTDLLNKKVCYCGKEYFLTNAIQMYVKKVFETLRKVNLENLALYVFQWVIDLWE